MRSGKITSNGEDADLSLERTDNRQRTQLRRYFRTQKRESLLHDLYQNEDIFPNETDRLFYAWDWAMSTEPFNLENAQKAFDAFTTIKPVTTFNEQEKALHEILEEKRKEAKLASTPVRGAALLMHSLSNLTLLDECFTTPRAFPGSTASSDVSPYSTFYKQTPTAQQTPRYGSCHSARALGDEDWDDPHSAPTLQSHHIGEMSFNGTFDEDEIEESKPEETAKKPTPPPSPVAKPSPKKPTPPLVMAVLSSPGGTKIFNRFKQERPSGASFNSTGAASSITATPDGTPPPTFTGAQSFRPAS